jgi:hypothetical protein
MGSLRDESLVVVSRRGARSAENTHFSPPVLFPAGFGLVVGHRAVFAQSHNRYPMQRNVLADQIPKHGFGPALAQIDVIVFAARRIRETLDLDEEAGLLPCHLAGDHVESGFRLRIQGRRIHLERDALWLSYGIGVQVIDASLDRGDSSGRLLDSLLRVIGCSLSRVRVLIRLISGRLGLTGLLIRRIRGCLRRLRGLCCGLDALLSASVDCINALTIFLGRSADFRDLGFERSDLLANIFLRRASGQSQQARQSEDAEHCRLSN